MSTGWLSQYLQEEIMPFSRFSELILYPLKPMKNWSSVHRRGRRFSFHDTYYLSPSRFQCAVEQSLQEKHEHIPNIRVKQSTSAQSLGTCTLTVRQNQVIELQMG